MLLTQAGIPFTVVASTGDEETVVEGPPDQLALGRATIKALGAVLPSLADGWVLGADTVVALGPEVFGKPLNDADGFRILQRLQGTTHQVLTGHYLRRIGDGVAASGIAQVDVTMRPLNPADIRAYLATGEHRGRAGAYAIQETGDRFVTALHGPWDAVVGLHLDTVHQLLRQLGRCPRDFGR